MMQRKELSPKSLPLPLTSSASLASIKLTASRVKPQQTRPSMATNPGMKGQRMWQKVLRSTETAQRPETIFHVLTVQRGGETENPWVSRLILNETFRYQVVSCPW